MKLAIVRVRVCVCFFFVFVPFGKCNCNKIFLAFPVALFVSVKLLNLLRNGTVKGFLSLCARGLLVSRVEPFIRHF